MRLVLVVLVGIVIVGCTGSDEGKDRAGLEAANREWMKAILTVDPGSAYQLLSSEYRDHCDEDDFAAALLLVMASKIDDATREKVAKLLAEGGDAFAVELTTAEIRDDRAVTKGGMSFGGTVVPDSIPPQSWVWEDGAWHADYPLAKDGCS